MESQKQQQSKLVYIATIYYFYTIVKILVNKSKQPQLKILTVT